MQQRDLKAAYDLSEHLKLQQTNLANAKTAFITDGSSHNAAFVSTFELLISSEITRTERRMKSLGVKEFGE